MGCSCKKGEIINDIQTKNNQKSNQAINQEEKQLSNVEVTQEKTPNKQILQEDFSTEGQKADRNSEAQSSLKKSEQTAKNFKNIVTISNKYDVKLHKIQLNSNDEIKAQYQVFKDKLTDIDKLRDQIKEIKIPQEIPNSVQIWDFDEKIISFNFIIDYCPQTLQSFLEKNNQKIEIKQVAGIMHSLLLTIKWLHQRKINHLFINTKQIFLEKEESLESIKLQHYLIGVVKRHSKNKESKQKFQIHYAAPEIILQNKETSKSDI